MQHVKDAIFAEIRKAKDIATRAGYSFPDVVVRFDLKGTCAGRAIYKLGQHTVRFNLDIAKDNLELYIKRTVNHELAHVLQHKYNLRSRPHGREWAHFCRILTGSEMPRCHTYKVDHLRRKKNVKIYLYKCNCETHKVSTTIHNRIMAGRVYSCKSCKNKIEPI